MLNGNLNAKLILRKLICADRTFCRCCCLINSPEETYLSYKQAESNWDCDNAKLYRPSDGESTNL